MSARNDRIDLYLVRHAFAAHADPTRWPDDAVRPLTDKGSSRFREPQLLHEVARWPAPEECPALEAARPASAALGVLRGRTERSLALVGHEPHLSRLASLLCAGSEDALQLELKKGAVAALSFAGPVEPARALLRWTVPPRVLRRLDR
jgi:phosphohistidine phosphatase